LAAAQESARTTRAADVLWADFCQAYPMQSDWLIQDRPEGVTPPDWGERLMRQGIDCELVKAMLARTLRSSVFQRPGVSKPQVTNFSDVAAGLAEYERIRLLRRLTRIQRLDAERGRGLRKADQETRNE